MVLLYNTGILDHLSRVPASGCAFCLVAGRISLRSKLIAAEQYIIDNSNLSTNVDPIVTFVMYLPMTLSMFGQEVPIILPLPRPGILT